MSGNSRRLRLSKNSVYHKQRADKSAEKKQRTQKGNQEKVPRKSSRIPWHCLLSSKINANVPLHADTFILEKYPFVFPSLIPACRFYQYAELFYGTDTFLLKKSFRRKHSHTSKKCFSSLLLCITMILLFSASESSARILGRLFF